MNQSVSQSVPAGRRHAHKTDRDQQASQPASQPVLGLFRLTPIDLPEFQKCLHTDAVSTNCVGNAVATTQCCLQYVQHLQIKSSGGSLPRAVRQAASPSVWLSRCSCVVTVASFALIYRPNMATH